ncbi:MAG: MFS transporter [Cytophagales bacterium]|nr:MAG: MFS transporter [Cytophagales bacterium]
MLDIQKKLTNSFFIILSLPATAMGFALSVQISALSWILSTKYQLDIESIGYVWASGPLAGIIGQLIIGVISDKVWLWGGRRKPFILLGGILASLMLLALPNIDVISQTLGLSSILWVAIIVALTLDLAINVSFNPTRSIIADVTPQGEARTKGYTWMQTISGMFGVLAYGISVLFDNYILIYLGVFLVLIFSFVPPFFIKEPTVLGRLEGSANPKEEKTKNYLKDLLQIYVAHAFTWLGIQTMFVFAFAYFKQKMGSADNMLTDNQLGQMIGISFAILNTVGFILPSIVLEPVSRRIGSVRTHTLAIAVMAIGYLGIVFFGNTPILFYSLMTVVGVGWAATVSLPFAIMTEKIDKEKMGFFMGIFNLSVVIPQLIVSFVFGKIIENSADKNIIFIISAASLAISALLWLFVKENKIAATEQRITSSGGH